MKALRKAPSLLASLVTVMVAGAFALGVCPTWAWAEDTPFSQNLATTDGGNRVNPSQMPDSSFLYDTSIMELSQADSYLNNQRVQVVGEAVGERINAEFDPDNCWISLKSTDGSDSVIAVYTSKSLTEAIDHYGSYNATGSTVQVSGTFYLVCPQHEGVSDLHADALNVIALGADRVHGFHFEAFLPGIALLIVGLVLFWMFRRMREGQR